jgi:hypothetical protein
MSAGKEVLTDYFKELSTAWRSEETTVNLYGQQVIRLRFEPGGS